MRATLLVVALAVLTVSCSKDPEYAKQEYLKSGDRYVAEKKYREAVVQYRNAIQQDPQFGQARLKLAQTYEQLNDPQNAFREYIRAADLLPKDVNAQVKAAGYLLWPVSSRTPSREHRRRWRQTQRTSRRRSFWERAWQLNNLPDAIKQLEEAVQLDPQSAAAYTSLGAAEVESGRQPAAEEAFRNAVETNPRVAFDAPGAREFPALDGPGPGCRGLAEEGCRARTSQRLANRAHGDVLSGHSTRTRSRAISEKARRRGHQRHGVRQAGARGLLRRDEPRGRRDEGAGELATNDGQVGGRHAIWR